MRCENLKESIKSLSRPPFKVYTTFLLLLNEFPSQDKSLIYNSRGNCVGHTCTSPLLCKRVILLSLKCSNQILSCLCVKQCVKQCVSLVLY